MAKRNRERAKQAKRKAKEERKAQRVAGKLQSPQDEVLDQFGNPIEASADLAQTAGSEGGDAPDNSPEDK